MLVAAGAASLTDHCSIYDIDSNGNTISFRCECLGTKGHAHSHSTDITIALG